MGDDYPIRKPSFEAAASTLSYPLLKADMDRRIAEMGHLPADRERGLWLGLEDKANPTTLLGAETLKPQYIWASDPSEVDPDGQPYEHGHFISFCFVLRDGDDDPVMTPADEAHFNEVIGDDDLGSYMKGMYQLIAMPEGPPLLMSEVWRYINDPESLERIVLSLMEGMRHADSAGELHRVNPDDFTNLQRILAETPTHPDTLKDV